LTIKQKDNLLLTVLTMERFVTNYNKYTNQQQSLNFYRFSPSTNEQKQDNWPQGQDDFRDCDYLKFN
jgi:hypothetical protein